MQISTDIVIVGTGLAGLSLAKYLSESNPKIAILLLSKTTLDECNTYYAQGGIAVVHDFIKDSYEQHIADTLSAGKGLCNVEVEHFRNELKKIMNYESVYGSGEAISKSENAVHLLEKEFENTFPNYAIHPFLCETYNLIQTAVLILDQNLNSLNRCRSVFTNKQSYSKIML